MKGLFASSYAPCTAPGTLRSEEASPLISYPPTHDGAEVAREVESLHVKGDATSARIRYVGSKQLEAVKAKLSKGQEISRDEVMRLGSPERLLDDAMLVPIDLGMASDQGLDELLRKHGPRGTAQTFLAARDRAETNGAGEPITAKELRVMSGEADNILKPLLLAFIALTALGTVFVSATQDATRPFFLATLLHLTVEAFLWSYLLFGPEPQGSDRRRLLRVAIRFLFLAGAAFVGLAPLRPNGRVAPAPLAMYCALAVVSESVCLWLGAFYYFYRLDVSIRRLGAGLFIHGFAFQITAFEYVDPSLFEQDGTTGLRHWGWLLFLVATCCEFLVMIPVFKAPRFNIRAQQPSALAAGLLLAGAFCSAVGVPALAWSGARSPDLLLEEPSFLPRGNLLIASRALGSAGAVALLVYALNEYALTMPRLPELSAASLTDLVKDWVRQPWASARTKEHWLPPPRQDSRCSWCPTQQAAEDADGADEALPDHGSGTEELQQPSARGPK